MSDSLLPLGGGAKELLECVLSSATGLAVIATDPDGVIRMFSEGAERLTGYCSEEVIGSENPLLFHAEQQLMERRNWLKKTTEFSVDGFRTLVALAEREGHEEREWDYVHRSGQKIPVRLKVSVIRSAEGLIAGYLFLGQGLSRQKTEGQAPELSELKAINEKLRLESQRTETILDNVVDGIITINHRGQITSFNPAALAIFGYELEDVLGRNVSMLMPEPNRSQHDGYMKRYLKTGEQRIMGAPREVEALRADGTLFTLELSVSEVPTAEGVTFLGVVRDISERKRLERMKSEFVSTVSHELRTPLTSIAGSLGMVSSGKLGELPPKARNMIRIAHRNSHQLSALINDLLDMEKLVSGRLPLNMQATSVKEQIQQAVENIQAYADENGVVLRECIDCGSARIRVDSHRFQQILANLLSNAIKFSSSGEEVLVRAETRNGQIVVSVQDKGPGIPESFRSRVFEKFAQADSSDRRRKGGTGLGLAITRELTERMGGEVDYTSVEGDGATFYVLLPDSP